MNSHRGQEIHAQATEVEWADSLYTAFKEVREDDPVKDLGTLKELLTHLRTHADPCRMAHVNSWIANIYDAFGQLDSAVMAISQALALFHANCDSLILMSINVNRSNIHLSLDEINESLDLCENSLRLWNEDWAYSIARNGLYTNRAISLAYLGRMPEALDAFKDVLFNARKENKPKDESGALINLGALFGMMGQQEHRPDLFDSSVVYQRKALAVLRSLNSLEDMMILYSNLASLENDRKNPGSALTYLDSSQALADTLNNLLMSTTIANTRSQSFLELGEKDSAYHYLMLHLALKDSLLNTEKVKAIADVQEKYESEKKMRTIKELEVKNLDAELRKTQLKRTRNIYMFSGIGIFLIAGGLLSRLNYVRRSRAMIQKEKDIGEALLHNILPEEVAEEIKLKGYAEAREFEHATILFTDFKGFTAFAEQTTASGLVEEIDHCFKAFDAIIEKYNIEKIKTIGDAYMAAAGLPEPDMASPADMVNAALEMQEFMRSYKKARMSQDRPYFEMRVGIHTGPVVAGIVGVKKFAYDIWGDTVNVASRMESSGEVGQVNISEATFELVKDVTDLKFTARGKVEAKGKGELEMYFVEPA